MFTWIRSILAKREFRTLIGHATHSLYDEQFDFDLLVSKLSWGEKGVSLLKAYVSIQCAARITTPPTNNDIEEAFLAYQQVDPLSSRSDYHEILDVHKELAKHYFSLRQLAILKGKVAYAENADSLEGSLYEMNHANRGPISLEYQIKITSACNELAAAYRDSDEVELRVLKTNNPSEHAQKLLELEIQTKAESAVTKEAEDITSGSAEIIEILNRRLVTLLRTAPATETQEDPNTLCCMGDQAFDGEGVDRDYERAITLYKSAAKKGSARAQHNLAVMFESGEGVNMDLGEAVKWYRMAADQGYGCSINNLGLLYESGKGVPQDRAMALKLFRMGAKANNDDSQDNATRLAAHMQAEDPDRKRYEAMLFAYSDMMADNPPLIGDCRLLPYPKQDLLYAISWLLDEYETCCDDALSAELRQHYEEMLPTVHFLFTTLARDWQVIDLVDMPSVRALQGCKEFPEWALLLKRKYIDEARASKVAAETKFRVMQDRVAKIKTNKL